MIDAALITALLDDGGVSGLVSDRVFVWGSRQGTAYPYVTAQRISTAGASHLNGPNTLEWPRFQIDCWAQTALAALNCAEAVRAALDNITVAGDPTFTATFQDQSGPAPDGETRSFRVSQDYLLFHSR
jgi:hypothetical protein